MAIRLSKIFLGLPHMLKQIIDQLLSAHALNIEQSKYLMNEIMQGNLDEITLTCILIALKMKGESLTELSGFAEVMQQYSTRVTIDNPSRLVDIVGTGGDSFHSFNISTASSFVAAGAGVKIAKHGNRSASGLFGSADVLEACGINLNLSPIQVSDCIQQLGIGFMFAPNHHPAMKYVQKVRKKLGVRTIFNLLGPLTNPSYAKRQVIGVYDKKWLQPFAATLKQLGSIHSLIVHSKEGMDELSCFESNYIVELKNNEIFSYELDPHTYQLAATSVDDIKVSSLEEAVNKLLDVLAGKHSAARNIVVLNAGAAIYTAGITETIKESIEAAIESIDSHAAMTKLTDLKKLSNNHAK